MGIEDFILSPLFKKISLSDVQKNINEYIAENYRLLGLKKINLNIQIPYCLESCSFCHCNRVKLRSSRELKNYTEFLAGQIRTFGKMFKDIEIGAIFFSGGSPSLLSPDDLNALFDNIFGNFHFKKNLKIYFEANPQSLTSEKLKVLSDRRIFRISLGVQSLDKKVLKKIGRRQDPSRVHNCIKIIQDTGSSQINVDLVPGLPEQTVQSFLDDLKTLISLKVDVITVNPYSDFLSSSAFHHKPADMSEFFKKRHDMIVGAKRILDNSCYRREGFSSYQLKTASQKEAACTTYPGSVLGIGTFAKSNLAGKIVFQILPVKNKFTSCYFQGYRVDKTYTMAQYLIMQLLWGLPVESFKSVFGEDVKKVFSAELAHLKRSGILAEDKNILKYCGKWSIPGLFDYFSYTKIFFGKRILNSLIRKYSNRYHQNEDFSLQKHFTKIMGDLWLVRTYYDLGYMSCWI